VKALGVEADRADEERSSGRGVSLHQARDVGTSRAGGADGDALDREPGGLLGEEHQGGAAGLSGTHGHQQGDGHALGVLEAGDEADGGLVAHRSIRVDVRLAGGTVAGGPASGQKPEQSRNSRVIRPSGPVCA